MIKFLYARYKISVQGLLLVGEPDKPLDIANYLNAKKVTRAVVLNNIILDAGTIAFGIALGFTTLFDNAFISGLHNLGLDWGQEVSRRLCLDNKIDISQ